MHHETALIATVAVGFGLAFVLGLLAARLRLPPLVGYLVAGVVVGPFTPGFVADASLAQQLSEIGVILLMFGVGIHFSLGDLLSVKRIAVPGALVQIAVATVLGAVLAHFWGWSWGSGIVFGLCLSVASTVVLLRALEDRGILNSDNGRIAVGWLIVEDLATVIVLVLLPALAPALGGTAAAGPEAAGHSLLPAIGITLAKVVLFVALMVIVGSRAVPWLLERVARIGSRELFTLAVLAIALGTAVGAAYIFDVSFALGAFFAGTVVNGSRLSHEAAQEALPLQDAFSVLFFVAVGMLFDPSVVLEAPLRVLAVVLIVMIGKSIGAFVIVTVFGYSVRTAAVISASLAQIGEFSFILVALGLTLGVLPTEAQNLIVAGALISITLNPLAFIAARPFALWLERSPRFAPPPETADPVVERAQSYRGHAVIIGHGRVGGMIVQNLAPTAMTFVVVEESRETVNALRNEGIVAIHGDATRPAVLNRTGLQHASILVVTAPDPYAVRAIIEAARRINPQVHTVARTHSAIEKQYLEAHGADVAVMGEHELALTMARRTLEQSGMPFSTTTRS